MEERLFLIDVQKVQNSNLVESEVSIFNKGVLSVILSAKMKYNFVLYYVAIKLKIAIHNFNLRRT
jgi:hypothetical protein